MAMTSSSNPIQQWVLKYKEAETGFKMWSSKLPVEAVVVTAMNGVVGAFVGKFLVNLVPLHLGVDRQAIARVEARNYSAMLSVNCGLRYIMKGIRGKDEDLISCVVAGAGSGLAFSLVSQGLQGQPLNAFSTAAQFAVFNGVWYTLEEMFGLVKDPMYKEYTQSRAMLLKLGLEKYDKNFKKGYLRDPTLPLLTDKELKEVKIPAGARVQILDHIQRDPEIQAKGGKE